MIIKFSNTGKKLQTPQSQNMRLFIAIEIPDKIKQKIEKETEYLKKRYPTFRWVKPENYHLTLLFLGEVKEKKLEKIKKRLEKATFSFSPFLLFSYSYSLFIHHKIVVYISFKREKQIEKLAKKIREEFKEFTLKNNSKKFIPHLTIARGKIPSKQQYFVLKKLLDKTLTDFHFKVEKITLYNSILTPQGPVYKKLSETPLLPEEK